MRSLLSLLFSFFITLGAAYGAGGKSGPNLNIVPSSTSTIYLSSGRSPASLTYTVTNESTQTAHELVLNVNNGLNQTLVSTSVTGDTCSHASLSAKGSTCTFTVVLTAKGPEGSTTLAPQVCKSAGVICSIPTSNNRVTVQTVSSGAPQILTVSPTSGSHLGSQQVTITGSRLHGATSVKFGTVDATIQTDTPSKLVVLTGASSTLGPVTVEVTTPEGTATDTNGYTYNPTITATAGSNGSMSPSGVVVVSYNGSQTFTATPNSGYGVQSWSLNSSPVCGTSTTCVVSSVTSNSTLTVAFTPVYTVATSGLHLTVTPSSRSVSSGNTGTFVVTADTGYTLSNSVGGTCPTGSFSGSTYTTGAITSNCLVSFSATQNSYTVTPSGLHVTVSPSTPQTVLYGNTQVFTVTADTGYTLSNTVGGSCPAGSWSGSTYTTGAITGSCSVAFTASQNTYTVTPGGTHVSISPSTPQTVAHGSTQAFTVTADTGYSLTNTIGGTCPSGSWSGSTYTTGAITSNCAISFSASTQTYAVTPSGTNVTIIPSGTQTVSYDETQSFTVMANSGYTLNNTVGGTCPTGEFIGSTYVTGRVTGSCTVSFLATATSNYTVTPSGTNVTVSPSTPQTVLVGNTQAFTVTADSGYTLSHTVGGTCPAGSWSINVYTTGAITGSCSVSFSATASTEFIVTSTGSNVSISPSTPQTVTPGNTQAFTVSATSGFTLSDTVGGTCPAGSWSGTTYTTGAVSADCSVYFAAYPASGVVGVMQSGSCVTSYPGTTPITCNVVYTNYGSTTVSNPTFLGSVTSGGGSVATGTGQCTQINPTGGNCVETYTYTPAASSVTSPELLLEIKSTDGSQVLAVLDHTVDFVNPLSVYTELSCSPSTVVAGQTATCSVTINNAGPGSTYNATLTPGAVLGTTSSQTPSNPVSMPNALQTVQFTYTAPSNLNGNTQDTVTFDYTDNWGNSLTINPYTIGLVSSATVSAIRCNPDPGTPGSLLSCYVLVTNIGSSTSALPGITTTIGGTSVSNTNNCSGSLEPNTPCKVAFSRVLPTSTDTSVTVSVAPTTAGLFTTQNSTFALYSTGQPNIQSNPLTCSNAQLTVGGSATTSCSVLFRNLGTQTATGVTLTPNASVGSVSGATTTCSSGSNTMGNNDTCVLSFTYTPPISAGADSYAQISADYSDTNIPEDYPAFQTTYSILLQNTNLTFSASVIPNTSNVMPANNITYTTDSTLQVIFHFFNATGAAVTFDTPVIIGDVNGATRDLSYALDTNTTDSSCLVASPIDNNAGCNLTVNFTPYDFNGFKIGDQVILTAWLPISSGGTSMAGTWDFSIGASPIFNIVTSEGFSTSDLTKGAFVFGNTSGNDITTMTPRLFLPEGFKEGGDCSSLVANYTNSGSTPPLCSSPTLSGTLPNNTYCYECFDRSGAALPTGTSRLFQTNLVGDQGVFSSAKLIPVTSAPRTLKLKNNCAGPVWPAFISGAAYNYCNQDSDCPLNTVCYVPGHQCMVPKSSGSDCVVGTNGYELPSDFPTGSGCSKGANQEPAVCPPNSSPNSSNGLCYWNLPSVSSTPTPPSDYYYYDSSTQKDIYGLKLDQNATVDMLIPNTPLTTAGDWSTVWSGGIVPRTDCTVSGGNLVCATGQCTVSAAGTDNNCKPGDGAVPPITQGEFTFLYQNQDYYDIEIINGANIPVSMKPTNISAPDLDWGSPYVCNAAGEKVTNPNTSASNTCSWNFTMNSYDLSVNPYTETPYSVNMLALHMLVEPDSVPVACTPSTVNPCTGDEVCGLTQADSTGITSSPSFKCGIPVGFWSSNQLCANSKDLNYGTLNCSQSFDGSTLKTWFGCNGGYAQNSCYSTGASVGECCGCPYWDASSNPNQSFPVLGPDTKENLQNLFSADFVLSPNANNDYCQSYTSNWITKADSPSIIWMKQGCSSVYTFPYDDATSTFTCSSASLSNKVVQNPAGQVNTQDYTITFCPEQNGTPTNNVVNGVTIQVPTPP